MDNNIAITVDTLSYKELQGLAMSLNLPGKMKQGVLVEAIKARQNHNEQAVTMILEANRQRRIIKRQHQLQLQQQQLLNINREKSQNNKRKCVTPARTTKRSINEMQMDSCTEKTDFKRSKLVTALIQQRRPPFFNSFMTGPTSLNINREPQQYQQSVVSNGGCSAWDQNSVIEPSIPLPPPSLPIIQKTLPDLSKELLILPTLSDCSSTGTSSSEDFGSVSCSSVDSANRSSSSNWSNMSGNVEQQTLPQSSCESCDSGWMGTDDSYEGSSWKNMPNIKLSNLSESVLPSSNNSSGYFEDHQVTESFSSNGDIYRPEDFISISSTVPNCQDYQLSQQLDVAYTDSTIKSDPWYESSGQSQFQPSQQLQQQLQNQSNHNSSVQSRFSNDYCYEFDCYQQGGPYFRILRPGNPTAVFVPSGRSLTLSTFCNMLPRVASYVQ